MPKQTEISTLYGKYDVSVSVPSTYEEGDALVGEVGGVLEGFIADCSARNFLPRLYREVGKLLAERGHARAQTGTEKKKDDSDRPVFESNIVHIGRVHDAGDDALKKEIGDLLRAKATELPFYEKGERGGLGKISQEALNLANGFFAEGDEKVEEIIGKIESKCGHKVAKDSDGSATPATLARGIMELQKSEARKAAANALA